MEIIGWITGSILALAIGSFMNVVTYRLPRQVLYPEQAVSLWWPGSRCPDCAEALRWYDNIPLISWLALRGRCRACGVKISLRYPLLECATLLATLLLVWLMPIEKVGAALLLCWTLMALSLIDAEHLLLPDALTLPLLWLGLLLKAINGLPGAVDEAIMGAIAGYGVLTLLASLFHTLRGYPGLGAGDAKLLAALGAWLGWRLLPFVLLIACSGAILYVLIARLLRYRDLNQPLAFGPWLSLAGISLFIHSNI